MLFNRQALLKHEQHKSGRLRMSQEGSFTVEMSILFPIILLIIVTMISFAFYINDLVCIRAMVNRYAASTDNRGKTVDEIIRELQTESEHETLIVDIKRIRVENKKGKIEIGIDVHFKLGFWETDKNNVINVTMQTEDTTSFIVKAKVFMDIAEYIKGDERNRSTIQE